MVCFEHNKIPRLDLVNWYYYFFCPLQTLYHTPFLGGWWTIPSHPNLFCLSKWESWKKKEWFHNPTNLKPNKITVCPYHIKMWIFESLFKKQCLFLKLRSKTNSFSVFLAYGVVWKREKEIKYSLLFSSEKNGTKQLYVRYYEEDLDQCPNTSLMKRCWSVQNLHQPKGKSQQKISKITTIKKKNQKNIRKGTFGNLFEMNFFVFESSGKTRRCSKTAGAVFWMEHKKFGNSPAQTNTRWVGQFFLETDKIEKEKEKEKQREERKKKKKNQLKHIHNLLQW